MTTPLLCGPINEYPVYKLLYHGIDNRKDNRLFVFVGRDPDHASILQKIEKGSALAKDDAKKLEAAYGKNFKNKLGISYEGQKIYVKEKIFHDDSLSTIKAKIVSYLDKDKKTYFGKDTDVSVDEIYMWCSKHMDKSIHAIQAFVNDIFSNKLYISPDELRNTLGYMLVDNKISLPGQLAKTANISKQNVLDFLLKNKFDWLMESLGHKFVDGGINIPFPIDPFSLSKDFDFSTIKVGASETNNTHSVLIETIGIRNNMIHFTFGSILDKVFSKHANIENMRSLYFPLKASYPVKFNAKKVADEDAIIETVQMGLKKTSAGAFEVSCTPNFVHLRVNENSSVMKALPMQDVFARFKPNASIPFAKLITGTKTVYKVMRSAITGGGGDSLQIQMISRTDLSQWTKFDKAKFVKSSQDILVLKVAVRDGKFATVILHSTGMYDVKLNYKVSEKTSLPSVNEQLEIVNRGLDVFFKTCVDPENFIPLIDKSIWMGNNYTSSSKVFKLMTSGTINTKSKTVTKKQLEDVLRRMTPFFSFQQQVKSNVISLMYKRINNFTKQDNIIQYMNKHHNFMPGEKVIEMIKTQFNLDDAQSQDYYEKWKAMHNIMDEVRIGAKIYYKPRAMNVVNVRVKPTKLGYKFVIDGITSIMHQRRIIHAIKFAIEDAGRATSAFAKMAKVSDDDVEKKSKFKRKTTDDDNNDVGSYKDDLDDLEKLDKLAANDVDDGDDFFGDMDLDQFFKEPNEAPISIGDVNSSSRSFSNSSSDGDDGGDDGIGLQAVDMKAIKESMQCPAYPKELKKTKAGHKGGAGAGKTADTKKKTVAKKTKSTATKTKAATKAKTKKTDDSKAKVSKAKKKVVDEDDDEKGDPKDSWLHKYILNQLYDADKELFYFEGKNKYAKTCQKVNMRQPVVMSKMEMAYNEKCFPGALPDHVNYGSREDLASRNMYSCPKVWCPKSRVALTAEQYKAYGNKCPFPDIDEQAILFESKNYWKGKDRHIGFLEPAKHPKGLCMPCCFIKKMKEETNKCTSTIGNEKYIKTESFPVEEKRYGLLPPNLSVFFGNKFCGGQDGGQGLMNEKTDCFLRYGIPLTNQSFLQCIASLMDNSALQNPADVVKSIVKNLTIENYLTLGDGLLCRKFINDASSVYDIKKYQEFAKWFVSSKNANYVAMYNLQPLKNSIAMSSEFNDSMLHADDIHREFLIYSSFMTFIKYIEDNKIPKSHDMLIDLCSRQYTWLNKNGYNILVIETDEKGNAYIACPIYQSATTIFQKERPVVLIIKQGSYYEPIHHVKYIVSVDGKAKKGVFQYNKTHLIAENAQVQKIVKYYLGKCPEVSLKFDGTAQTIVNALSSLGHAVKLQVLNYELHVIGYVTIKDVFVPLRKPVSIAYGIDKSTVVFADRFFKSFNSSVDAKVAKTLLKELNKNIGEEYYELGSGLEVDKKVVALNVKGMIPIPLVPMKGVYKAISAYTEFIDDNLVFIQQQHGDARKTFIDVSDKMNRLQIELRNELINIVRSEKGIMEEIALMRHPSNPIPKEMKRIQLKALLEPLVKRAVIKRAQIPLAFKDAMCSFIGKRMNCTDHCVWVDSVKKGKVKGGKCKLSIPSDYYNLLFEKCIEDLLNPAVMLKVVKVGKSVDKDDDTIVFTDSDISSGNLANIIDRVSDPHKYDFKMVDVAVGTDFAKVKAEEQRFEFETNKTVDVPTDLESSLKNFRVYVAEPYDRNFIYKLFSRVQARINNDDNDFGFYKSLVVSRILSDYEKNKKKTLELLNINASFEKELAELEDEEEDDDNDMKEMIKSVLESSRYYPGDYEISILSELSKVNIIIESRKTKDNPDKLRCLGRQSSDFFIILKKQVDTKTKLPIYSLYAKNGTKYILTSNDIDPRLSKCFDIKCKTFTLGKGAKNAAANMDLICPPYKKKKDDE